MERAFALVLLEGITPEQLARASGELQHEQLIHPVVASQHETVAFGVDSQHLIIELWVGTPQITSPLEVEVSCESQHDRCAPPAVSLHTAHYSQASC